MICRRCDFKDHSSSQHCVAQFKRVKQPVKALSVINSEVHELAAARREIARHEAALEVKKKNYLDSGTNMSI